MAEVNTTKKGRPKKTEETPIDNNTQNDIIQQLMKQIEQQNKVIQDMQNKLETTKQSSYVTKEENFGGKKVKVINLMHNMLNISTEPDGQGRVYSFEKYGDSRMIKFDDLNDIVASYPNATENGLFYIANPSVVDYFDLTEEYKNIYTKEMIDDIVKLKRDEDVDLFLGMNTSLRDTTAIAIANRINANEEMDYNNLRRIKTECGIDIELIANELKEDFKQKSDE